MRRVLGLLGVLCLASCGCEPGRPEIVPMTPPGISPTRIISSGDEAEALGEQGSKNTIAAPTKDAPTAPSAPSDAKPAPPAMPRP